MIKKILNYFFKSDNNYISVLWYLFGTVLVQGINFLMTPVLTNMMSVDNYGMLSICSLWTTVFATFVTLQVHGSINNALIKYGRENINSYVSSIQFIELLSFIVILSIGYIFKDSISNVLKIPSIIFLSILFTSFFQSCIQLMTSKLVAEKKHKRYFVISLLFTLLSSTLSIVFIHFQDENTKYYGKIFGTLLGTGIIGSIILLYIFIKGKTFFNIEYTKFCLKLSLPLVLHGLSQVVLGQSDRYMIKLFAFNSDYNVGIYGYAYTIGAIINVIWLAFNYAWVPWYYEKCESKNTLLIKKISNQYCIVFTTLTSVFILISPEIVKIMAPNSYWEGIKLVPLIITGFFFMFLYSFPVNYEFYKQKTFWISTGTVFAATINIILNYFLIPTLGAFGASVTTLVSYMLLFVFHYIIARFVIKNFNITISTLLKYVGFIILILLLFYFIVDMLLFRWIVAIGIFSFVFINFYNKNKFKINKFFKDI